MALRGLCENHVQKREEHRQGERYRYGQPQLVQTHASNGALIVHFAFDLGQGRRATTKVSQCGIESFARLSSIKGISPHHHRPARGTYR